MTTTERSVYDNLTPCERRCLLGHLIACAASRCPFREHQPVTFYLAPPLDSEVVPDSYFAHHGLRLYVRPVGRCRSVTPDCCVESRLGSATVAIRCVCPFPEINRDKLRAFCEEFNRVCCVAPASQSPEPRVPFLRDPPPCCCSAAFCCCSSSPPRAKPSPPKA